MTDEKLSPKEYLREHDADGNATIRHTHDPASGLDAEPPDSRPLGGAALALLQHEALAALAHERWSGWMGYVFEKCAVMHPPSDGSCVIPPWAVERWKRQMATPYAQLSEEEKESDRKEASRVTAVLGREWKIAADELDRKLNDMAGRLAERLLELGAARTRIAELERAKDGAYAERNQVIALLARMALQLGWRAGVGQHPAEDTAWEADWRTILFIDLPTGQASWHFHDSERHLLAGLPAYSGAWDGHTTDAKYERVRTTLTRTTLTGPHHPRCASLGGSACNCVHIADLPIEPGRCRACGHLSKYHTTQVPGCTVGKYCGCRLTEAEAAR